MQTGVEKSQIFIAILLINFRQHVVNPVYDTKRKYIYCFRSTPTCQYIVSFKLPNVEDGLGWVG